MRIAETFNLDKVIELALKYKDKKPQENLVGADVAEVAMLAAGTLELDAAYGQLKNEYTKVVAENVILKHSKVLARLAEHDTSKPTLKQRIASFFKKRCGTGCCKV
jgi:hypothetical protein